MRELLFVFLLALPLVGQDYVQLGAAAYNQGNYAGAVENFQKAVELEPNSILLRLHLANAWSRLRLPGAAQSARATYEQVLEQDPNNQSAIWGMASLAMQANNWTEAQSWSRKLLQIDPASKEAYYNLGVIAFATTFRPIMEARARAGLTPQAGVLPDTQRLSLRAQYLAVIEDGISSLRRALELDDTWNDPMAYLNLLYRSRAYLEDEPATGDSTTAADQWTSKSREKARQRPVATLQLIPALPPPRLTVPPPPPPRPSAQ